jgi:polyisoprenoid-binding protein YceI
MHGHTLEELLMILSLLLALLPAPWAATYQIDTAHTYAGFTVEHMMVSDVHGAFSDVTGTILFDAAKPADTKADVSINTASVDTRLQKRDDHLRSPDFFDAVKFPAMTFKSKSVKNPSKGTFQLVGDLTIRGVTKEVVLDVKGPTPEYKDPWGNTKIGFSATGKINRKDFGLNWNQALEAGGVLVGEEVAITIEVEAAKQK